jgi:hypothetical protein
LISAPPVLKSRPWRDDFRKKYAASSCIFGERATLVRPLRQGAGDLVKEKGGLPFLPTATRCNVGPAEKNAWIRSRGYEKRVLPFPRAATVCAATGLKGTDEALVRSPGIVKG